MPRFEPGDDFCPLHPSSRRVPQPFPSCATGQACRSRAGSPRTSSVPCSQPPAPMQDWERWQEEAGRMAQGTARGVCSQSSGWREQAAAGCLVPASRDVPRGGDTGLRPLQTLKAPSSSPSSPCRTVHRGQGQGGAVPTQPPLSGQYPTSTPQGQAGEQGVRSYLGGSGGTYPSPTQPLGSSLAPPGPPTCRSPYRQENLIREGTAASCWGPEPL